MVKKSLYIAWAVMLVLCGFMGFVPQPAGAVYGVMVVLAVSCFVPPAVIVYMSIRQKTSADLRRVRNLSALSITVTVLLLVGNYLSAAAPVWVGNLLYGLLVLLSSPMVCGQIWIVSLLLWAGLLWSCIVLRKKAG